MSIFRGSIIVVLGTFGIKAASLVKDLIVSRHFGINEELALYLSSFLIPSILSNQLGVCYQVLNTSKVVEEGKKLSSRILKRALLQQGVLSLILYTILFLFISELFPQENTENFKVLRVLIFLTLPYFFLMPVRVLFGQVLYVNQRHTSNFLLGFISPIFIILYLLLTPDPTAYDLVVSLALSSILEYIASYLYLKKLNLVSHESNQSEPLNMLAVFSALGLQALISSNFLIDQMFANRAGTEFLTVFNYAGKIPAIIGSLSMILSSSILLPAFQTMDLNRDKWARRKKKVFALLAMMVLGTTTVYFLSHEIVRIIYQRGNFDASATEKVANIQAFYFLVAPLTAIFLVFIRYLNALKQNQLATIYGLISFLTIILSNVLFLFYETPHFIPFSAVPGYCIVLIIQLLKSKTYADTPSRA